MEFTSELQRQRVLARWKRQSEYEQSKAVKDTATRQKLLARLIAYIQGDGSLLKEHADIMFYPDHRDVAKLFVITFEQLYGRTPRIHPLENHFRVRLKHKAAGKELISLTAFNGLEWHLPSQILSTIDTKREWLRAFFDCEAYVGPRTIVVNSVNETGLREVKQLLSEFGIASRFYVYHRKQKNWNTNYILVIGKKNDRQTFLKRIGFNHPTKQRKLLAQFAAVA